MSSEAIRDEISVDFLG
ncbi:hypothetical protein VTJ04DRAFT_5481 [Mycothermus thermophilus]